MKLVGTTYKDKRGRYILQIRRKDFRTTVIAGHDEATAQEFQLDVTRLVNRDGLHPRDALAETKKKHRGDQPSYAAALSVGQVLAAYVEYLLTDPDVESSEKSIRAKTALLQNLVDVDGARYLGDDLVNTPVDQLRCRPFKIKGQTKETAAREWAAEQIRRGKARGSVRSEIMTVRGALNWAEGADLLPESFDWRRLFNPETLLKGSKKKERRSPAVTADRVRTILARIRAIDEDVYDLLAVLSVTGWRPADLYELKTSDVDHNHKIDPDSFLAVPAAAPCAQYRIPAGVTATKISVASDKTQKSKHAILLDGARKIIQRRCLRPAQTEYVFGWRPRGGNIMRPFDGTNSNGIRDRIRAALTALAAETSEPEAWERLRDGDEQTQPFTQKTLRSFVTTTCRTSWSGFISEDVRGFVSGHSRGRDIASSHYVAPSDASVAVLCSSFEAALGITPEGIDFDAADEALRQAQ